MTGMTIQFCGAASLAKRNIPQTVKMAPEY